MCLYYVESDRIVWIGLWQLREAIEGRFSLPEHIDTVLFYNIYDGLFSELKRRGVVFFRERGVVDIQQFSNKETLAQWINNLLHKTKEPTGVRQSNDEIRKGDEVRTYKPTQVSTVVDNACNPYRNRAEVDFDKVHEAILGVAPEYKKQGVYQMVTAHFERRKKGTSSVLTETSPKVGAPETRSTLSQLTMSELLRQAGEKFAEAQRAFAEAEQLLAIAKKKAGAIDTLSVAMQQYQATSNQ